MILQSKTRRPKEKLTSQCSIQNARNANDFFCRILRRKHASIICRLVSIVVRHRRRHMRKSSVVKMQCVRSKFLIRALVAAHTNHKRSSVRRRSSDLSVLFVLPISIRQRLICFSVVVTISCRFYCVVASRSFCKDRAHFIQWLKRRVETQGKHLFHFLWSWNKKTISLKLNSHLLVCIFFFRFSSTLECLFYRLNFDLVVDFTYDLLKFVKKKRENNFCACVVQSNLTFSFSFASNSHKRRKTINECEKKSKEK